MLTSYAEVNDVGVVFSTPVGVLNPFMVFGEVEQVPDDRKASM